MHRENSAASGDDGSPVDPRSVDRQIDEELRLRFAPPPVETIVKAAGLGSTESGSPEVTSDSRSLPPPLPLTPALWALAATVAALLVAMVIGDRPKTPAQDERVTEWIATYDSLASGGPAPVCTCDPPCSSFTEHCESTFAQPLGLADADSVEVLGEPCCELEPGSVCLVAKCDGETVCLFVLLREAAPIIHEKIRRGLSIHRRDFGIFSAFELSSLPKPELLPRLVEN